MNDSNYPPGTPKPAYDMHGTTPTPLMRMYDALRAMTRDGLDGATETIDRILKHGLDSVGHGVVKDLVRVCAQGNQTQHAFANAYAEAFPTARYSVTRAAERPVDLPRALQTLPTEGLSEDMKETVSKLRTRGAGRVGEAFKNHLLEELAKGTSAQQEFVRTHGEQLGRLPAGFREKQRGGKRGSPWMEM